MTTLATKRVSARAPHNPRATNRDRREWKRERVAVLLAERDALRERIIQLFADGKKLYSVEVAAALGADAVEIKGHLMAIERAGKLTSTFVPANELPVGERISGLGRRYYRKVGAK